MKKYIKKVRGWVIFLFLLYGIGSIVSIFGPIVNANLLSSLTELKFDDSFKYALLFLIISVFNVLTNHGAVRVLRLIQEKLLFSIRYDMLQRLFSIKTKVYDTKSSGEFQERVKSDPEDVFSVFSVVQYSAFSIITETIILIYIFILNLYLGLVYLIGIILIYVYEKFLFKKVEIIHKESKKQREKSGTIFNEIFRGIRDIKQLGISTKVSKIANSSLDRQSKLDTKSQMLHALIYNGVDLIKALITCAVVFVGILLIKANQLTLTSFLLIFFYRSDVFSLVLSYTSLTEYAVKYRIAKNRILELFNNKKFPAEKYGTRNIDNIKGRIEFKNVTFAYNQKPVLNDVSFKIVPLTNVALVGKSGSGKSTLFNLLTKSYDEYTGTIKIDGVDIKTLKKKSLINGISIINQNPYVFNLSIKDNLKLVNDEVTDEEMVEACKVAHIHDYIMTLKNGYETILGEGGVTFSGGQKQRLAIARALLKKSKILLFDEATSALDNVTQNDIQEAIKSISDDFTIITIAHRLSTIVDSDVIYVLDEGKIVASGTHKELMKTCDYYKNLYKGEK